MTVMHRSALSAETGKPIRGALLLTLALLSAIAPFATDLYLPAFPRMSDDLVTSATGVQLTLTAFLAGASLGQLIVGPLSDRIGRRGPLVVGALLCVVASVGTVLAPSVGVLIFARLLQGLAGSAGMVIGRAVISDVATGSAAARAFSLTMLVGGIAPVLAPLIGGLLAAPLGWRGLLAIVLGLSILMLIAVSRVVPETHPKSQRLQKRADGNASALLTRPFMTNTLVYAFAFGALMAYISASPFLYQDVMGLSVVQYSLLFGLNALALVAVSAVSARQAHVRPPSQLLGFGIAGLASGTAAFVVLVVLAVPAVWLTIPLLVAVASLGLVLGNATALALAAVPRAAGSGSAALGALQFALGAVVSAVVGIGGGTSAVPLAVVMGACVLVAGTGFALSRPRSASLKRA
jgi:DHA1 family bicyclomycin/chloramphenicol resistance-like MFS transporter